MTNAQADIGLIGLAVMGQNLALNMNDKGFTVAVFNRTESKIDEFLAGPAKGSNIIGVHHLENFLNLLKRPRKVILMVKAGAAVDDLIKQMLPYLEEGDIIIDGGNSLYTDTERRYEELSQHKIRFVGAGVSGGEEGARHGPSIMPGGDPTAWKEIKPIFQAISAHVDGEPCCDWVGKGGAGHYVKMVHNGIEYGDMQLICEAYHLLRETLQATPDELKVIFQQWNKGNLNSYLIEITAVILGTKNEEGEPLIDYILDAAGQKGTGKWTAANAFDLGMPLTLIGEAVFARCLSALKEQRLVANRALKGPKNTFKENKKTFIEEVGLALYASKIISYAQGFMLMQQASKEYKWDLNLGAIALMWRGGCIIRSQFLGEIKKAYARDSHLDNLLLDPYFMEAMAAAQQGWRHVVSTAALQGVPLPCMSTALAFYDGYRCANLPANLLQAQRDYFGAHTYERVDRPRGQFFHTNWTGTGGLVSSTSYNV